MWADIPVGPVTGCLSLTTPPSLLAGGGLSVRGSKEPLPGTGTHTIMPRYPKTRRGPDPSKKSADIANGAVMVTRVNYSDLVNKKPEWDVVIEEKILMPTFIGDDITSSGHTIG